MSRKNIYISGFMGTGKSSLARHLSLKKSLPCLDLDHEIETKTGKRISEIFQQNGEAYFRGLETQTLLRLHAQAPLIISLGGGVVISPINRSILAHGLWINLNAQPRTVFNRIQNQTHRPLLNQKGQVDFQTIEQLWQKRQSYYQLAPWQIPTDGLSEEAILNLVLKII